MRLRKYVTEQVTQTVPVRREEVRLEREPVTDTNVGAATSGPELTESEHEVILHEERPVVDKEVVPRERVRSDTGTVTDERQVGEEVGKEIESKGEDQLRGDDHPELNGAATEDRQTGRGLPSRPLRADTAPEAILGCQPRDRVHGRPCLKI